MQELATDLRKETVPPRRALRTVVDMTRAVDPARRRRIRLVAALSAALLLAGALAYTTFTAASDAVTPSQLVASASPGRTYQLTGKVAAHSVHRQGDALRFVVRDRNGRGPGVLVFYRGTVPDPFREGREVIVTVKRDGEGFVGQRDSLVTKCPSKFQSDTQS